MNRKALIYIGITLLFVTSCTSRKGTNPDKVSNGDSVAVMDSMRPDTLHHPSPDEFTDDHIPPPDGKHFDGPPPPPPHGKGRPPHKPDNMRGFDPASEDDMEDNGMSRYMENNDEEGRD
jgi:hypothetical protein